MQPFEQVEAGEGGGGGKEEDDGEASQASYQGMAIHTVICPGGRIPSKARPRSLQPKG